MLKALSAFRASTCLFKLLQKPLSSPVYRSNLALGTTDNNFNDLRIRKDANERGNRDFVYFVNGFGAMSYATGIRVGIVAVNFISVWLLAYSCSDHCFYGSNCRRSSYCNIWVRFGRHQPRHNIDCEVERKACFHTSQNCGGNFTWIVGGYGNAA